MCPRLFVALLLFFSSEYESHYKLMQIKAEFVKGRDFELQVLEDFTRGKIHSDIGRFESSDKDDAGRNIIIM